MKKRILSRKGASIELALSLLVVTFSLSALILATSYLAHIRGNRAERDTNNFVVFEQIGQDFIDGIKENSGTAWTSNYPDYDITVNALTLTVREKGAEETLFEAQLTDNANGTYTITKWSTNLKGEQS